MYLGSWKIDDYLTFCVNTHSPTTGAATDADSVPTYRIYEDETTTAITNGSTAKLDDANTTGFYSDRIQLLAATGFEKGKTYTIYLAGTVGGVTGTTSHTFQIEAEVDANVVSDKTGFSLAADQSGVTVGTVSTLTGHTVQTGDSYAIVSSVTYGNSALKTLVDAVDDYVDTEVAAIKAVTDNIPDSGALTSLVADVTSIKGYVDTEVAAIKAVTDNLPNSGALTTIGTAVAAIQTKTDALPSGIAKNTALSAFSFPMVLSSDHVTAATGKTITGTISKDGGAFASLTNSVSEISNGLYKVNLTATELNADVVVLRFTETDCDQRVIVITPT